MVRKMSFSHSDVSFSSWDRIVEPEEAEVLGSLRSPSSPSMIFKKNLNACI